MVQCLVHYLKLTFIRRGVVNLRPSVVHLSFATTRFLQEGYVFQEQLVPAQAIVQKLAAYMLVNSQQIVNQEYVNTREV